MRRCALCRRQDKLWQVQLWLFFIVFVVAVEKYVHDSGADRICVVFVCLTKWRWCGRNVEKKTVRASGGCFQRETLAIKGNSELTGALPNFNIKQSIHLLRAVSGEILFGAGVQPPSLFTKTTDSPEWCYWWGRFRLIVHFVQFAAISINRANICIAV